MNAITIAVAAAVLSALAQPAWSQSTGYNIGASVGRADHPETCQGTDDFCDNRDAAFRVSAGRQFNPHFGLEVAYHDLGKSQAPGRVFEANAFELVGIGSIPLVQRLSAFAKVGIYRAETWLNDLQKESNADLTVAFGLRYDFTRWLAARADWQRYVDVGGDKTGQMDINVVGAGLLITF